MAPRTPWQADFPPATILRRPEVVQSHPDYRAAKDGDWEAAARLVADIVTDADISAVKQMLAGRGNVVVAVHAEEASGRNKIPLLYAALLADRVGLRLDDSIVQARKVNRGGSDGFHRIATQVPFAGTVDAGTEYLIVDDTLAQGGTLASLKGYLESKGGVVVGASALMGKQYSATLAPTSATLDALRSKYGAAFERWWKDEFGYGFDRLTESEARYLISLRGADADAIRNRILAARQSRDGSEGAGALQGAAPGAAQQVDPPAQRGAAVSANTIFTEDAAAAARARLKAKLGRLNSGIDPEMLMDGITLAGYHIEKGARSFAAYAKAMIEDLGEGAKPFLKSWYLGVRFDPRAAGFDGMDGAAAVEAADVDVLLAPQEAPKAEIKSELDAAAHEAATSPLNDLPQPSDEMKFAGNYKVGRLRLQGLDISIENPRGSVRSGTAPDGSRWQNTLAHHYGYIRGSEGSDGDHLDVFLTDDAGSATSAWVIDQKSADGAFDEHKIVIGPKSEAEARAAYLANYDAGWDGLGAITSMPIEAFRSWALDGRRKRTPLAYVEPPVEFEHNGVRIYPANINVAGERKQMWAVESAENKAKRGAGERHGLGDALFDSREQAVAAADRQIENDRARAEFAHQQAEQEAREQAEKAERDADTINGFLEGKAPNTSELIRKALDKQWRFDGRDVMTARERIESLHRAGALEVSTIEEPKIKPMSRAQFNRATQREQDAHERKMREAGTKATYLVNGSDLGKYAYDHAQHLLSRRGSAEGQSASQPLTSEPFAQIEEGRTALVIEGDPAAVTERLNALGIKSVPRKTGVSVPNRKHWDTVRANIPVRIERYRVAGVPERLAEVTIEVLDSGTVKLISVSEISEAPSVEAALERYARSHADAPAEVAAAEPTHQDPGEPAEPATRPVIAEAIRESARNTAFNPVEAKRWLLGEIDRAIANVAAENADIADELAREKAASFDMKAAERQFGVGSKRALAARDAWQAMKDDRVAETAAQIGFVTFDVPGDGKFKVVNTVEKLQAFRKKVESTPGFRKDPTTGMRLDPRPSGLSLDQAIADAKKFGTTEDALQEIGNAIEVARLKKAKDEDKLLDRFREASGGKEYDAWRAEQEAAEEIAAREAQQAKEVAQIESAATGGTYTGPADVSSRAGQMELANRAGRIASLKAMNAQLRAVAPDEAWADGNIENATDLDALQDGISTALVAANRAKGARPEENAGLRQRLEEASGHDLKAVFDALSLAGKNLTHGERVEMLLQEDAQQVTAALDRVVAGPSGQAMEAELDKVPATVRDRLGFALTGLRSLRDRLASVERARGKGHMLALEVRDVQPEIEKYRKTLDEFRGLAPNNGVDADLVIRALGGEPDFSGFGEPADAQTQTDYKGFERNPLGNGVFDLRDGNMTVRVEPMGGDKFQASFRGAKSSPHLQGEQGAADWADAYRSEAQRTEAAAPVQPAALEGSRRDPAKVSVVNPYEDGDVVRLADGQEWQVRSDVGGWYLTSTGNWRGTHPTIQRIKAMNDLIREIEQAAQDVSLTDEGNSAQAVESAGADAAEDVLTPDQAVKRMEWRDGGQRDGEHRHTLMFREDDNDRNGITVATLRKYGKGEWTLDDADLSGDIETFDGLREAKKAAQARALRYLEREGFVRAAEPTNDRDSFTMERIRGDAPVRHIFRRGDRVKAWLRGEGDAAQYTEGDLQGISHAQRKAKVGGVWYDFGAIYPAEREAKAAAGQFAAMSDVVDEINAKHGEGLTEADRILTFESFGDIVERLRDGVETGERELVSEDGRAVPKDDPDFANAMRLADILGLEERAGATVFSVSRRDDGNYEWDISGQDLRSASTFGEAREAAKAFQGRPLESADGVRATISRNNLDKMLSASAVHKSESVSEHALAVANLDTLFGQAVTGWTKADRGGDPNIRAVRRMFAPMRVGDKARLVKLTVKEFAQTEHGNRVYSVEAIEVGEVSPVPEMVDADRADGSRLLTGPTGLVDMVVRSVQNFNGAAVPRTTSGTDGVAQTSETPGGRHNNSASQDGPPAVMRIGASGDAGTFDPASPSIMASRKASPMVEALRLRLNELHSRITAADDARSARGWRAEATTLETMIAQAQGSTRDGVPMAESLAQAAQAWRELAVSDEAFAFPRSDAQDIGEIARTMSRGELDARRNGDGAVEIGDALLLIDPGRREAQLDVTALAGDGNGQRIYQIALTWAHNNGYTLAPFGALSPINNYRRTEAMLSSALRHGTTAHMKPAASQIGLEDWRDGDDDHNLRILINANYQNVAARIPEIASLGVVLDRGHLVGAAGDRVTRADLEQMVRTEVARRSGIGVATLARAVFTRSVLRMVQDAPRLVSGLVGRGSGLVDLAGILYSRDASAAPDAGLTPGQFRAALVERFGEDGVASLERQGLLNIAEPNPADPTPAWYDTDTGRAYFAPSLMADADAAVRAVIHEIGEHHGLESALGPRAWRTLKGRIAALARDGKNDIAAAWAGVLDVYPEFAGKGYDTNPSAAVNDDRFMHEVIAKIGETAAGRKTGLWRDILAAVNRFLLKLGIGRQINKNELADLVAGSLKRVMAGQGPDGPRGGVSAGVMASAERSALLPNRAEASAYRAALAVALSSLKSNVAPFKVMTTPAVLQMLGAEALPITISRDVVRKATNGVKHDVTMEAIERLPEELANPVMVFESATQPGDLVVLTEYRDQKGKPVMVAVGLGRSPGRGGYVVNEISSAYGRKPSEYMGFIERGLLRYRNTAKSPDWLSDNGLQLPNSLSAAQGFSEKSRAPVRDDGLQLPKAGSPSRGSWDSVATEADAVNWKKGEAPMASRPFDLADHADRVTAASRTVEPAFAADMTEAQKRALRKVGLIYDKKTFAGRVRDMFQDFGKRFVQGVFDQYAPLKEIDQHAYMLARMSAASDGGLEAMMLFGKPVLDADGALDVQITSEGGFMEAMRRLDGDHDRLFAWVAGQRAAELKAQGRENLLTDEDISVLADLDRGEMPDGTSRAQAFAEALKTLQAYNKAALDIAEQSGLIDGESRALWESEFYVPFYRVMEEGIAGPSIKSGLVGQYAFKKLKGGTQDINDLFKNTLTNWSHLLSAAAKNRAALASMQAAQKLGIVHEVEKGAKGAVKVMEGGVQRHFIIDDPYLMDAVAALEFAGFGPFMKPFQKMKQLLTMGVTISPTFKIANLIRDTLAAVGQNPIDYNPIKNLAQGWKATHKGSQTYASMLAGGGMFRFGTMLEGERAENAKRLIESGIKDFQILDTPEKVKAVLRKWWSVYEDIGDRSENVNRAAIYEQLRAKGMSHMEASFMARDMMDFSLQGKWAMVRFLAQVVPFMNARLQGLYKLGRAGMADKRRFAYVVGALSAASIALMLMQDDDEDWKRREDWDRDTYWWVKIGGIAFYIPKPFELGAIGTLAERTTELFINDEMDGARYRRVLASMFANTFAMSPVPQLVKPLLDVYANQDSFTGRAIETMGMERLKKEDRASAHTTGLARVLGSLGLPDPAQLVQGRYETLSPAQMDYLIRGYLGSLGAGVGMTLDVMMRPLMGLPELPSRGLYGVPIVGRFVRDAESPNSRYITEVYEDARRLEQVYASYRDALKRGDSDRAARMLREDGEEIRAAKNVAQVKRRMGELNREAMRIREDRRMGADEKQAAILRIRRQQEQLAKQLRV